MNKSFFVSTDASSLLVRDVIDELRTGGRLTYESGGYNEAYASDNIVSVDDDTTWKKLFFFAETARSVLRTYALHASNLSSGDLKYSSRAKNTTRMIKEIRHEFAPASGVAVRRFIAEFDRLFPPFVIRQKLESRNSAVLNGELHVVDWSGDTIHVIHKINCTVRVTITERNEDGMTIIAVPHAFYYKINVKKPEASEGRKCAELMQLLERHRIEQEEEETPAPLQDAANEEEEEDEEEEDEVDEVADALANQQLE